MYIKKRFESKNEAAPPEVDSVLKKNAPKLLAILNDRLKASGSDARLTIPDPDSAWFSDGWYLRVKSAGKWDDSSRMLNLRLDGTEYDGVIYKDGEIYLKKGSRPMSHRGQVSISQIEKQNEKISPYLTDIAYKILTREYGWTAASIDDVKSWLKEHQAAFEKGYGDALRKSDDEAKCVKAGIDAVLDDEENAVTDAEIAMSEGMDTPLQELCDGLNRYAIARNLPYKADVLDGANGPHIVLHNNRRYLDVSYNKDNDLEVYKVTDAVGSPSHTFAHWDNLLEISARLLGIMDRYVKTENRQATPEAKVASSADGRANAAGAVRDFLATYLKNELEDSVDLDYAVRTYDDVYPYVEVVDKDFPDNGAYLTLYVYSPLGDGNFKIAYKYFEHPNNRIDCPTNVTGLEGVAKMFAMLVLGKSAVKESSEVDDYLAQFKEEFETQWGPYGWEKAYALILNTEDWLQFIKDNWANNDYSPAEMAEYAIETWFNDESKTEGASTYTFTWWDNAPAAERRPTTRADLKNSKHKETFTAKDDADALEQAVQFLLDEDGDDRDDYDSAEEVWDHFDFDWGSGSPIPMVLKQGRRVIKDSGFDPAGDESKRKSESSYEKLEYEKGHKNSKGEDAPWVIRSHTDGRVLASFAKKADAEQHLARMKNYADKN